MLTLDELERNPGNFYFILAMSFQHNHNCIFVLFTSLWMQLKQICCGLVVVWTTLQGYLLIISSKMQTAVKVVISFPVNMKGQKTDVWCVLNGDFFFF